MNTLARNLILMTACLLSASLSFGVPPKKFPAPALAELDNGEIVYAQVTGGIEQRKRVQEGYMMLHYSYYTCSFYSPCSRTVPKGPQARKENIIYSTSSLSVETQGVKRNIAPGVFFRTADKPGQPGRIFKVLDVFEDGRIAAFEAEINPNSRNRKNGNLRPMNEKNAYILHKDDIDSVQVDSFLGFETNHGGNTVRYKEIEGIPLCDAAALNSLDLDENTIRQVENFSCRVDGSAPIHAIFSDGTMYNGPNFFNPFPETIERYYYADQWGQSTDI